MARQVFRLYAMSEWGDTPHTQNYGGPFALALSRLAVFSTLCLPRRQRGKRSVLVPEMSFASRDIAPCCGFTQRQGVWSRLTLGGVRVTHRVLKFGTPEHVMNAHEK